MEISKYSCKEDDNFSRVAGNVGILIKNLQDSRTSRPEQLVPVAQSSAGLVLDLSQPESLSAAKELAYAFHKQGRWKESLNYFKCILTAKRRALGEGHAELFPIMNMMGQCYLHLGRLDDALEWHQKSAVLATQDTEKPEELVCSKCGVASIYQQMGRGEEAKAIYEEVVEMCQNSELEVSQVAAVARNSLAVMHMDAERYEDARRLFERGAEILLYDMRVSDDNRDLLTLRANLGLNQTRANRLDDAIKTLEEVYHISKSRYGVGDDVTKLARQNLLGAYHKVGRTEDVLVLFHEGFLQGQFQEYAALLQ
jgi:tetratricopeptide (TPR) repeat protein